MNKRLIDYRDCAGVIIKALQPGILVTTLVASVSTRSSDWAWQTAAERASRAKTESGRDFSYRDEYTFFR